MPQKEKFDVVIVGAGPAGIFASLKLVEKNSQLKILLLEKGSPLEQRVCPSKLKTISCLQCNPCRLTAGWGGAGAYSDGKLNLGKKMAGWLPDYINQKTYEKFLQETDDLWLKFGAGRKLYGVNHQVAKIEKKIKKAGFKTLIGPTRHLGTEKTIKILANIYQFLNTRIKIKFNANVEKILTYQKKAVGVQLTNGQRLMARMVIVAPGREGCGWFYREAKRLGLTLTHHPVQLGVRVETKASVLKPLTDVLYEAKLFNTTPTFKDQVRTFCMCPYGEVVLEQYADFKNIISVNGHSFKKRKTKNTNFALLVSTDFTEPFDQPILYAENITRLANLLGKTVIIQRLGDLLAGRRSTPVRIKQGQVKPTLKAATPGDLSFVLPYRHLTDILEMLKKMDKIAPGIYSFDTLLYGVEVKFYSSAPKLDAHLETEIENLLAVGDGAGVTRNLTHACISGMVAAEGVFARLK